MDNLFFQTSFPKDNSSSLGNLILLHGRGADELDLLPIGKLIGLNFNIFSIRAPKNFIYSGYTWFDMSENMIINDDDFHSSYLQLSHTTKNILSENKSKNNFILGFSQGAVMAFAIGLANPELFSGVIAQSGFAFQSKKVFYDWDNSINTKFLLTHGEFDPIVPINFATKTKILFAKNNLPLDYLTYPIQHEISEQSIFDVKNWISKNIR